MHSITVLSFHNRLNGYFVGVQPCRDAGLFFLGLFFLFNFAFLVFKNAKKCKKMQKNAKKCKKNAKKFAHIKKKL